MPSLQPELCFPLIVAMDSLLCFHLEICQVSSGAPQEPGEPGCTFGYCQSLWLTQKMKTVHSQTPNPGAEMIIAINSLKCISATVLGCKVQVKGKHLSI